MNEGKLSHIRAKPTILMRVVAACWFALTGFIPALLSFLATWWKSYSIGSRLFFGFVLVPTLVFAVCGATIGARILSRERVASSATHAMGCGAAVAGLSLGFYVLGWAMLEVMTADSPGPLLFAGTVFYLMALWASIRMVPLILIGAFSGWMLSQLKTWLVNGVR